MANVKKIQKYVKGHGQGHMFKIYGTAGKILPQGTHMPNMKALSLRITRGATVTGCAPVVSFCCKGLY